MSVKLSGMNVRLSLGSFELTAGLVDEVGPSNLYPLLDLMTDAAERERLKGQLLQKREELRDNRAKLADGSLDRNIIKAREDRARYYAEVAGRWVEGSRRGEFKPNEMQQGKLGEFDRLIASAEAMKRDFELGIPMTEWQIDCLYARIHGQAEPPMPDEVKASLPQMLPDVSAPQSGFPQLVA